MNINKQVNTQEQGVQLAKYGLGKGASHAWIWDSINGRWDVSSLCYEAIGIIRKTDLLAEVEYTTKKKGAKISDFDPTTESYKAGFFPAYTVAELGELIPHDQELPVRHAYAGWVHHQNGGNGRYKTEAEARGELLILLLREGAIKLDLSAISV